jgi:hypothetical protein
LLILSLYSSLPNGNGAAHPGTAPLQSPNNFKF